MLGKHPVAGVVLDPSRCCAGALRSPGVYGPLLLRRQELNPGGLSVCRSVSLSLCVSDYGVVLAIQVAWALGYRLVPLNEDRAFLADSLVRGAMELGNPNNAVLGVDPKADLGPPGRGRQLLAGVMWKGKVILTGVLMKVLLGMSFPWSLSLSLSLSLSFCVCVCVCVFLLVCL